MAVSFDQLVHDINQGVQLLSNFEDRLGVITQNARLIPLHVGLFALDVHDLDNSLFDVFEPFFRRHRIPL